MLLTVLDPGFLTTVQDLGRSGWERFGVPACGAMDRFALRAANTLVGNPPNAAAFESLGQGPTLLAGRDLLVAASGPGFALEVDGWHFPAWMSVYVRAGAALRLVGEAGAVWGYLAVAGGIDTPPVMGSRSTYLRGGFGGLDGRMLAPGDVLPVGRLTDAPGAWSLWAGRWLPPGARLAYAEDEPLGIIPGPQAEAFTPEAWQALLEGAYTLSPASDRMGYRLVGPHLSHRAGADILSDGIPLGAVQVPGEGQPIVMMSDRQTTGGYTKMAVVAGADLPRLAQRAPGTGGIRFTSLTVEEAQRRWRALIAGLESGIDES